jgi:hypothetical protein
MLFGAQIAEVLVDVGMRPVPRHLVRVVEEAPYDPLATVDGIDAEVARELLPSPACQHLLEDLVGGIEVANAAELDHPTEVVNRHKSALRGQCNR